MVNIVFEDGEFLELIRKIGKVHLGILTIAVVVCAIFAAVTFADSCRISADKEMILHTISGYAAIACVIVILFLRPVSDLFYYGGMILTLVSMLLFMGSLFGRFNMRCSHAIPSFLDRKEAE